MKTLEELKLKLYVVSAGVMEVVKESFFILQTQKEINIPATTELCMTPEIYNDKNFIIGFQEPTIITTNKHMFVSHEKYPEIKKGNNAIVMGDLIEDINMVKNLELNQIITVGFYNSQASGKSNEVFKRYVEKFDIVVLNDGNLTHVANILSHIAGLTPELQFICSETSTEASCELPN